MKKLIFMLIMPFMAQSVQIFVDDGQVFKKSARIFCIDSLEELKQFKSKRELMVYGKSCESLININSGESTMLPKKPGSVFYIYIDEGSTRDNVSFLSMINPLNLCKGPARSDFSVTECSENNAKFTLGSNGALNLRSSTSPNKNTVHRFYYHDGKLNKV